MQIKTSFIVFPFLKIPILFKCNGFKSYLEILNRKPIIKYTDPHSLASIFWVTDGFKMYFQFFLVDTSLTIFYTNEKCKNAEEGEK